MVFAKQPKDPPTFPHKTEWWEEDSSPPLQASKDKATNEKTNSNTGNNYGSTGQFDEEEPAAFLLDNIVNVSFPSTGSSNGNAGLYDEFGIKDVPSDISNNSSSDEEDGSSGYSDEDDLEPPHRTCGLIFFDFLRFVAVSADMRLINTQIFPVFLDWKKMDILHISLRVLMTVLTLLLLLVEFPSFFRFLRLDYVPGETPPFSISNWIPRGIFYIFLSLVSFEQAIVVRAMDEEKHADTFSRFFNSFFIFGELKIDSYELMNQLNMIQFSLGMVYAGCGIAVRHPGSVLCTKDYDQGATRGAKKMERVLREITHT